MQMNDLTRLQTGEECCCALSLSGLRQRFVTKETNCTIFTVADDFCALSLLRVVGKVADFLFRPSFQDYPLVC